MQVTQPLLFNLFLHANKEKDEKWDFFAEGFSSPPPYKRQGAFNLTNMSEWMFEHQSSYVWTILRSMDEPYIGALALHRRIVYPCIGAQMYIGALAIQRSSNVWLPRYPLMVLDVGIFKVADIWVQIFDPQNTRPV